MSRLRREVRRRKSWRSFPSIAFRFAHYWWCRITITADHPRRIALLFRWLQDLEEQGHEIVIHGYFHERPRRDGENPREKFLTRFYTNDEGEFYDLDYDEAFRRITRARDEFVAAGLTPRGFIAPAWLLGSAAERAAAEAEMEYTTRLTGIRDLRSGDIFPRERLPTVCAAAGVAPRASRGMRPWRVISPERHSPA